MGGSSIRKEEVIAFAAISAEEDLPIQSVPDIQ